MRTMSMKTMQNNGLHMNDVLERIIDIMMSDPLGRNFTVHCPRPDLKALCSELLKPSHAFIVTGFAILAAQYGENDGPSGACELALTLEHLGWEVTLVTDEFSADIVTAVKQTLNVTADIAVIPTDDAEAYCKRLLSERSPTHVIAIERPGKTANGTFRNMRGLDMSHLTADTDSLLSDSVTTIAVGDGGNELGMGNLADIIEKHVAFGDVICARKQSDFPLVAGISNWWAWGLSAVLGVMTGKDLLIDRDTEFAVIKAMADAGAVDGTKGKVALSVDGMDIEDYLAVLERVRQAIL